MHDGSVDLAKLRKGLFKTKEPDPANGGLIVMAGSIGEDLAVIRAICVRPYGCPALPGASRPPKQRRRDAVEEARLRLDLDPSLLSFLDRNLELEHTIFEGG